MGFIEIIIIVGAVLAVAFVALFFLNRWAGRKMAAQEEMIQRHKTSTSIYVIDKKRDKISKANLPKSALDQMPRYSRIMKMPLVKAKVGAQVMVLMCDKNVYEILPVKKTVTVDLAGMYIVSMKGMKTKYEMSLIKKEKRKQKKQEAKAGKK
jgi:hypothetical protein